MPELKPVAVELEDHAGCASIFGILQELVDEVRLVLVRIINQLFVKLWVLLPELDINLPISLQCLEEVHGLSYLQIEIVPNKTGAA